MYVARDKIGKLYLHREKPYKFGSQWINDVFYFSIDSSLFPEVKWEDDEPTEVELIIKKKIMTPEVYVDKEIMPLLLKAKCPLERVIRQDFRPVYYTKDFNDEGWQDCEAYYIPTQAQVMKWLREVYDIHIVPRKDFFNGTYTGMIYDGRRENVFDKDDYIALVGCETYEEACNDAIKHCLTKLI